MSREIKFRGKISNKSEWICGNLNIVNDKYYINSFYGDLEDIDYGYSFKEVIPETVCQYTGLIDKNEKEIYEGDIIKYSHDYTGEIMREVVFKYGSYGIEGTTKGTHIIFGNILESEREVIGNIYENPNLLKEEE